MLAKNIDDYLAMPYTIEVTRDESDEYSGWFARVVELPGCMTQADTFEELEEMIEDAMRAWIEAALEDGQPIPEPRPAESYSGKFVVRVPKSLHRELAEAAEQDGVSLNTFVNVALGRALGAPQSLAVSEVQSIDFPAPVWPHLSNSAWRAMVAAGLEVEAQTVTEQMFADWLEKNIQQIEVALEMGYMKDAIWHLEECRQALKICGINSPIMRVFHLTVTLLESQATEVSELRAGVVQRSTIEARIRTQIQAASDVQVRQQLQPRASSEPTLSDIEMVEKLIPDEFLTLRFK